MKEREEMGDDLKRMLLAYTLCKDAINSFHVLQDHMIAAIFYTAVTTYYSIFKGGKKEKEEMKRWILNPPIGTTMELEFPIQGTEGMTVGETLDEIFVKYEKLRDWNIAHKDSRRREEDGGVWLRVPNKLGGTGVASERGILYQWETVLVKPNWAELHEFCTLVRATADVLAQKEKVAEGERDGE